MKTKDLNEQFRPSEVFEEDEEYDSEESDENGSGVNRASGKRRSFRKSQRQSVAGVSNGKPMAKLADLARKSNAKYSAEVVIEEKTVTQESPDNSDLKAVREVSSPDEASALRISTDDSGVGPKKFSLKLRNGGGNDKDLVSSTSSDDDDDEEE